MLPMEIAIERLNRNGLTDNFSSIETCVQSLFGIQAQIQKFAEISLFNRCNSICSTEYLYKLYNSYKLISIWGQRNTIHMYDINDWHTICDIYHDKTYASKYMNMYYDFFENVKEHIQHHDTKSLVSRNEVEHIINKYIPNELKKIDWITYMVLNHFCANGIMFGIPEKSYIKNFAKCDITNKDNWFFHEDKLISSFEKILIRYFKYYGPATLEDFSHWSGLGMKFINIHFENIKDKLNTHMYNNKIYYTAENIGIKNTRKILLLGKFDPLLVAYHDKEWIANKKQQKKIWHTGGHVEAIILQGGTLLGTWKYLTKKDNIRIAIDQLYPLSNTIKNKISLKLEKLALFLCKHVESITYN